MKNIKLLLIAILFLTESTVALILPFSIMPKDTSEDLPAYIKRTNPQNASEVFRQIIGAANEFKEGDSAIGVGSLDQRSREAAKNLILNTKVSDYLNLYPILEDDLLRKIEDPIRVAAEKNPTTYQRFLNSTIKDLKISLLKKSGDEVKAHIMPYLHSDIISALVKVMSNTELQTIGSKIYNPLPNSDIGKEGYLSARVQPNSPTDHPQDIFWQVMNAWSFGVGDLMLGNNPGSSTRETVASTESVLKEILHVFGHQDKMPWVVLSHIDIQNQLEKQTPGSTAMYFQSIAGTEKANAVFDISAQRMIDYAQSIRQTMDRQTSQGKNSFFGMYLETGQGSEFTNGAAEGVDMLTLESRKQGLGRAVKGILGDKAWLVLNDVSGFIGPEVFKTKDQLIRVALEDLIIAKLHGLTGGLDICSTFHMPITPKELREAADEIIKARPAYLMALPTQNDPMLSYNTTPFQEHLRLRHENNLKIDSKMMDFFVSMDVLKPDGSPGAHFADPAWVFYKYLQAKNKKGLPNEERFYDRKKLKSFKQIRQIVQADMKAVVERGVPLAIGHGNTAFDFTTEMQHWLDDIDTKARKSIQKNWNTKWVKYFKSPILKTASLSRDEYLSKPITGEILSVPSAEELSKINIGDSDVIIVISDGLNADAMMDRGHLKPYIQKLRLALKREGLRVYEKPFVIKNGRVRIGYRIGEKLFSPNANNFKNADRPKTVIHLIGERPGNGHNTFSAYLSTAAVWSSGAPMDHDRTLVVSGIADTAMKPDKAVKETVDKIKLKINAVILSATNSCTHVYVK